MNAVSNKYPGVLAWVSNANFVDLIVQLNVFYTAMQFFGLVQRNNFAYFDLILCLVLNKASEKTAIVRISSCSKHPSNLNLNLVLAG